MPAHGRSPIGTALVSIITPSLNQGAFIEQALQSVRAQTYPSIEHLVVDGGSTDGTLQILRRAGEAYGLTWISEPDSGMYDALNKGLKLARGEILGYLNCDDVYPAWAIETAVRALEADPTAVAVFGDGITIDQSNGGDRMRLSLVPPMSERMLALSGSLVQPAVFWRRSATDAEDGFDAGLRYVGDLDYWLRLGASGRFVRVDEVLAIERLHDAALSSSAADRMAVEGAAMRLRHHGASGWRARIGVLTSRVHAAWWRRRLFLGFLGAARSRTSSRKWARFMADGRVDVVPSRVALSFVPRFGARFAWDAVRSRRRWFDAADGPNNPSGSRGMPSDRNGNGSAETAPD